jgi:hypothetical protein
MVANIKAKSREIGSIQRAYKNAIPEDRRVHSYRASQRGDLSSLTPDEIAYVRLFEKAYGEMGTTAQQAGVISHLRKNYAAIQWDFKDTSTKKAFDDWEKSGGGAKAKTGAFTPHSLKRNLTLDEGKALGMKTVTDDPVELLGWYAKDVLEATEHANALSHLKSMKTGAGYAVEPSGSTMPHGYVTNHSIKGLEGFGIHPDMVKSVQRMFDAYEPGPIKRAALATAFTSKRLAVTYSLFHPMSLLVAYTGVGGNPFDVLTGIGARGVEELSRDYTRTGVTAAGAAAGAYLNDDNRLEGVLLGGATGFLAMKDRNLKKRIEIPYKSGVDAALNELYKGGAGDVTDFALRSGGVEIGNTIEETIGHDSFKKFTSLLDKGIGSDTHGFTPFSNIDKNMHHFIWDYLHPGLKLDTFGRIFTDELSDPKNAKMDVNEIAANVGSMTNNIYGGLNWNRVVEGMNSKVGRTVAGAAYSKYGRSNLQVGAFAPDWLMSTMRSWTQAVPGVSENAMVSRLHRAYIARSLIMTVIITDALNLHYSDHHIWENDFRSQREKNAAGNDDRPILDIIHDMTFVDKKDGTKFEANKHLFEGVHAMTAPKQFISGKMGSLITDPANIYANRQYLSPKWAPPITPVDSSGKATGTRMEQMEDYAKWMVKHHAPMSLQQLGGGTNNLGIVGFPSSGLTKEQKEKLKQEGNDLKSERNLK